MEIYFNIVKNFRFLKKKIFNCKTTKKFLKCEK